jgi:hypothetical protein
MFVGMIEHKWNNCARYLFRNIKTNNFIIAPIWLWWFFINLCLSIMNFINYYIFKKAIHAEEYINETIGIHHILIRKLERIEHGHDYNKRNKHCILR